MMKELYAGLFSCLFLTAQASPSDDVGALPRFFVAPVVTDVHRTIAGHDVAAYAIVDCSELVVDGQLDFSRLDEERLKRELDELELADSASIRLVVRYTLSPERNVSDSNRETIKTTLEKLCRSAGFETVDTIELSTTASWQDSFADVWKFKEAKQPDETIVEDELVTAYPLRTRLSRLAIGNADCVVEIKRPFDGRQKDLSEELKQSVQKAVESMGMGQDKGILLFRVSSTAAGKKDVEKLFDIAPPVEIPPNLSQPLRDYFEQQAAEYKPSSARKMVIKMGFVDFRYAHSPNGGAPEKLLGRQVPSFRLPLLDGGELELHSFLNNRPALVTFWGVACAPCQLEAPYLTAIHEKHAAEFAIVAVNAYDETREVVARYAKQAKLTHPILLNGSDVARKIYHVEAYPTSFWVDRNGIVKDYEIGFDSDAALERRVVDMLTE